MDFEAWQERPVYKFWFQVKVKKKLAGLKLCAQRAIVVESDLRKRRRTVLCSGVGERALKKKKKHATQTNKTILIYFRFE